MTRGFRFSSSLLRLAVAAATILPCLAVLEATPAPEAHPEDAAIIQHLNAVITWYKQLANAHETAGQPSVAAQTSACEVCGSCWDSRSRTRGQASFLLKTC